MDNWDKTVFNQWKQFSLGQSHSTGSIRRRLIGAPCRPRKMSTTGNIWMASVWAQLPWHERGLYEAHQNCLSTSEPMSDDAYQSSFHSPVVLLYAVTLIVDLRLNIVNDSFLSNECKYLKKYLDKVFLPVVLCFWITYRILAWSSLVSSNS